MNLEPSMNNYIKYLSTVILSISSIFILYKFLTDDAYIFYTYAENFVSGKGWVFNIGENVNALTSTLYPLLLIAGGKLGLDIQRTGIGLSLFFLGLSGLLLAIVLELITGKDKKASALGIFIGILFYLWHPIIPLTLGMETALNSTLILASLLLYYQEKTLWAAVTLGLLTLTRYDGALLAVIIGGDYLLQKKKLPWKEGLIYIGILAPWLIYSQLHFHTILPSTLQAKMDFGLQLNQHTSWGNRLLHAFLMALPMNILGTGQNVLLSQAYLLLIIVFGLIAFMVARKNTLYRIITFWGFCYAGAYAYLNVPFVFVWYWVPLILVLATWIGISIQYLYDQYWVMATSNHIEYKKIIFSSFYGFIPFLLFIHFGTHIKAETAIFQYTYQKELAYSQVADWINKNTASHSSILMEEIGFVGYYTHRRIIDQSGLATPEIIRQYQKGNPFWAYEHYQPDYLVIHKDKPEDACNLIFKKPELLSQYAQVTAFPWPDNKQILIYKRINE
jgi:hypothetical protein